MLVTETKEIESSPSIEKDTSPSAISKITTYLRWAGSLLIIMSAISFMLQGYQDMLPAYRYWVGLGLTLLLCAGGLVCAYLFKETKGARIFFGLGTAFLPVQVSQVSAMIYAYWHGQSALQPEYSWLQFMEVNPVVIVMDLLITVLLFIVVSYASYSMLARQCLKTLMIASAIGSAVLLLPIRDAFYVPFIIISLFLFVRHTEHFLHNNNQMRLAEGMAARALISLPLWIMVGRSFLHPMTYILTMVIATIVTIFCIYDIKRYSESFLITYFLQWVGTITAIMAWIITLNEFKIASSTQLGLFLPIPGILYALSTQVKHYPSLYRSTAAVIALFLTTGAMFDGHYLAPIYTIATGLLLSIAGIKHQEKLVLIIGTLCTLSGFVFFGQHAVHLFSSTPWVSSIILGLIVILLASYLEKKDNKMMEKSRHYFSEVKSWD
jgi:uncharacterized membrane protein YhdT